MDSLDIEEERKRQEELENERLAKKEAKKLAREEQKLQIKRDHLERERNLDEITLNKIKGKWYDAFLSVKVPEMQDNLKSILHHMEKLIETDSYRQQYFEEVRLDIDERCILIAQSHSKALDDLLDIYEKRVADLMEFYTMSVNKKKEECETELKSMEIREVIVEENMQTMLYQMKQKCFQQEDAINCDVFLKLDDEILKNTEKQETLRQKLERRLEKRWGDISTTLNNYEQSTQSRRKHYLQLKAKDDADSKIIHQQMKKTQKLSEQMVVLKKCLDNCYAPQETISLIKDLREEKMKFFESFKYLKKILNEELRVDETQLKNLTHATNSIISKLQSICVKGENILTLFRICLKYETEREKVIPVSNYTVPLNRFDAGDRKVAEAEAHEGEVGYFGPQDYEILDTFWKKMGNITLSKLALKKCVKNLEKENLLLKKSVVKYLQHISTKRAKM